MDLTTLYSFISGNDKLFLPRGLYIITKWSWCACVWWMINVGTVIPRGMDTSTLQCLVHSRPKFYERAHFIRLRFYKYLPKSTGIKVTLWTKILMKIKSHSRFTIPCIVIIISIVVKNGWQKCGVVDCKSNFFIVKNKRTVYKRANSK